MAPRIRRATVQDVPQIMRIYNEAILERIATADVEPRSFDDRLEWFEQFDDRHPIWVAEEAGQVVAYGNFLEYSPKHGYRLAAENSVYVASEARGRGLGQAMLEHLIHEARRIGFRYILARIFSHNEASLKLHARLGFEELGVQRGIVEMDGRWYDVTLMDLRL